MQTPHGGGDRTPSPPTSKLIWAQKYFGFVDWLSPGYQAKMLKMLECCNVGMLECWNEIAVRKALGGRGAQKMLPSIKNKQ